MKTEYEVGDKVKKWSSVIDVGNKRKIGKAIWTVTKVTKGAGLSQSGVLLDVEIAECPHCGANKRKMMGYDSSWFVKVGEIR